MRRASRTRRDAGFTLVELMVAMTLFLILGGVVLSAVVTMSKGLDEERVTSDISAEARVALERMARELRQANTVVTAQDSSMTLWIDFDGNGVNSGSLADPELVTYAYDTTSHTLKLTGEDASHNTLDAALLAGQVEELNFEYTSSNWAKHPDGRVDPLVEGTAEIDGVKIILKVEREGHVEDFTTNVTLRNRSQT
jgi:prepilin-type N-terminal cleavage/methylation domain-containing protein